MRPSGEDSEGSQVSALGCRNVERIAAMSVTRNNHYVPQWYQEGFFEPGRSSLAYVDMTPDRKVLADGRVITPSSRVESPSSSLSP
jgi:hypothetical protein